MTDHPLTDPRVQIIENARRDDVRPGDHITFTSRLDRDDVTLTWTREGIAHHRDDDGDWCTEGGLYITDSEGAGITITICRTTQPLPERDGAVIIPADGCEHIETNEGIANALVHLGGKWYGGAFQITPEQITTGTWKVADQ